VRPDVRQRAAPFHLFVDRTLWDEIGQPQHVQLQVCGGVLRLLPATRGERRRVFAQARTTIRIDCRQGEIGELGTGDYAASMVDGPSSSAGWWARWGENLVAGPVFWCRV
jgi:hypothetical protein